MFLFYGIISFDYTFECKKECSNMNLHLSKPSNMITKRGNLTLKRQSNLLLCIMHDLLPWHEFY